LGRSGECYRRHLRSTCRVRFTTLPSAIPAIAATPPFTTVGVTVGTGVGVTVGIGEGVTVGAGVGVAYPPAGRSASKAPMLTVLVPCSAT